MKILYISNQRLPTEKAYGIQIAKMCEALSITGHEVTLLIPSREDPIGETIFNYYGVKNNFTVRKISAPDFYFPGKLDKIAVNLKSFISAWILCRYARKYKAEIMYSRDEWPAYLMSFFANKIVFEAHNYSESRNFFYRRFLNKKIKIVTISQSLKNKFLEFGFGDNDILVAHDSVDLEEFKTTFSKEEARVKYHLPTDGYIVMYSGHLFPWKGANLLATIASRVPEAIFVFVGGTAFDLEVFRRKFSHIPNIIILGHKPHKEIPSILKAADILVLPNSAKEKISSFTSPLKLFEYMASEKPIIASDLLSIREVVNEESALLAIPDDAESLAGAIRKIIGNPDLANNLSASAFRKVQEFTWQKRTEAIIGFIK